MVVGAAALALAGWLVLALLRSNVRDKQRYDEKLAPSFFNRQVSYQRLDRRDFGSLEACKVCRRNNDKPPLAVLPKPMSMPFVKLL